MGLAAGIYAQELYSYGHGLPLWTPEPADRYEVRIGDVGHIDEDGQFHRLFNVAVGEDHPLNEDGVPVDFSPLKFNHRLLYSRDDRLPAGVITSKGMKSREAGGGASVYVFQSLRPSEYPDSLFSNPTGQVGAGFNYKFDCSKDRGAVLVLREPAKKTFVPPAVDFVSYMRRNHDKWYEYATSPQTYGLVCDPGDIILVRGTVKTKSWALAAYQDAEKSVHDISFTGQAGPMVSAQFNYAETSVTSAKFEHRIGPKHRTARPPSIVSSKSKEVVDELPEVLAERAREFERAPEGGGEEADDQCVFLQYYKVKYRFFAFKKISAAAGPDELPESENDSSMSPGVVADDDDFLEAMPEGSNVSALVP